MCLEYKYFFKCFVVIFFLICLIFKYVKFLNMYEKVFRI